MDCFTYTAFIFIALATHLPPAMIIASWAANGLLKGSSFRLAPVHAFVGFVSCLLICWVQHAPPRTVASDICSSPTFIGFFFVFFVDAYALLRLPRRKMEKRKCVKSVPGLELTKFRQLRRWRHNGYIRTNGAQWIA